MTNRFSMETAPYTAARRGWEPEVRETKKRKQGSLHDIIDVLSQDVQWLGVDIGISDKGAKVDYLSALRSHMEGPALAGSYQDLLANCWTSPIGSELGTHQTTSIDALPHRSQTLVYPDSPSFAQHIEPFRTYIANCCLGLYRNIMWFQQWSRSIMPLRVWHQYRSLLFSSFFLTFWLWCWGGNDRRDIRCTILRFFGRVDVNSVIFQ